MEVSIKPLAWRKSWAGSNDDIVGWEADTPWGRLRASVAGYRDDNGKAYERHEDVPEALRVLLQTAAKERYEYRVRSVLVEQVPAQMPAQMPHAADVDQFGLFQLWFFQHLKDEQRTALFKLNGYPTTGMDTHGMQRRALKHWFAQLTKQEGAPGGLQG